jgi:hypothetical protein
MPDISNARRPRRRMAYLLAPLVLAGSLALGGVAEAVSAPAPAAASSVAQVATTAPAQAATSGSAQVKPAMYGCSSVYGWSSKIFSHKGTEFWNHPGCHSLVVTWVAKPGWYQGFFKTMGPWGKWLPCGKPMNLWSHSGWALLCKWVPPCSKLRVLSLQGHIAPIVVKV